MDHSRKANRSDIRLLLARPNFMHMRRDIQYLLSLHDTETRQKGGRPANRLEVFKRSAIILTVTSWEAFIEDVILGVFEDRLVQARSATDFKGAVLSVATSWLQSKTRKPSDILKWTQDNWKEMLRTDFNEALAGFHSPNTEGVRKLSRKYLGLDLTASWRWGRRSRRCTCDELDRLIKMRGSLVHHGKEFLSPGGGAKMGDARNALALVECLVDCTIRTVRACYPEDDPFVLRDLPRGEGEESLDTQKAV
jgi:hypothetical protein